MARNFIDTYYNRDDEITPVDLEPVLIRAKTSGYEVIRIIRGIPLFLEDHIERLQGSLHSLDLKINDLETVDFREKIASLCSADDKDYGNIEILVTAGYDRIITILIGFVAHKYPEGSDYRLGVRVGIIGAEREKPSAKVKNTDARLAANAFLAESDCFEVLLKNRNNMPSLRAADPIFSILREIHFFQLRLPPFFPE